MTKAQLKNRARNRYLDEHPDATIHFTTHGEWITERNQPRATPRYPKGAEPNIHVHSHVYIDGKEVTHAVKHQIKKQAARTS